MSNLRKCNSFGFKRGGKQKKLSREEKKFEKERTRESTYKKREKIFYEKMIKAGYSVARSKRAAKLASRMKPAGARRFYEWTTDQNRTGKWGM